MTPPKAGESVHRVFPDELTSDSREGVRLNWDLSDEAIKEIEAIGSNIRAAEQRSGLILLR